MKRIGKYAIGALALAGAAAFTAAPADARVFVGFGVGPGYYGPGPYYGAGAYCDPYYPNYDPYYCGGPYYDGYYGPYWGGPEVGFGFGGGFHDRDFRGHWGHGGWGGGHGWGGHGGWGGGHHH